ncbi:hypothetical protein B0T11DRAFT_126444 [Plectosphaerella cucumerina]|uniref:Rhodopsin domain-containing protein n=1 Tax=Plectosphaerella cucumerina TaxID=40658 RepID=A0A8K0X0R5_9PEZI|nr:hypothetical protein B0T11DRAFT_126444 [Plectosphaerella cucumerina]
MKAEVTLPILGYVRAQLIVNSIIVFLMLVVVTLRVVGRVMGPGFGWDDGFVIFSGVGAVAMLVCQGLFAPVGNGYALSDFPELVANVPFILELTFRMQIIYVLILASVKASMLCFFLRIFVTPWVQRASKLTLGFVAAWVIAYLGACIFLCTPVSAQWTGLGKCGAYMPMIQSLIATNALGDLIILAIPMRSIWTLNMRTTDKVGITSCFALGLACVVCAIFRLVYISTVDLNGNITGTMPTTIFLFILEPNLAILCVSIPMLRPFYVLYRKRVGGSRLQESDMRPTGFRDGSGKASQQQPKGASAPGEMTTWEMEDYYPPGKASRHDAMVTTAGVDDESGSEKNLTFPAHPPAGKDIRVETHWVVDRN